MEKASKSAIVSLARVLGTRRYNGEHLINIEGTDLDCYDVRVTKVFLKGKCVMVEFDVLVQEEVFTAEDLEMFKGFQHPINVLTPATILNIWESMLYVD